VRRVTKAWRGLTTAAALTLSGHLDKRYLDGGMKSADVIEALEHVRRCLPNGFILICDHAPIHTTLAYFFDHPEIVVEPLPKYAPVLNPEEDCHGNVKAWEANATPQDRADMRRVLERGFARLWRRPDLLSFIQAAGLPVRRLWLS
jgi:hypothetical protein